jgi:hypothetical protein
MDQRTWDGNRVCAVDFKNEKLEQKLKKMTFKELVGYVYGSTACHDRRGVRPPEETPVDIHLPTVREPSSGKERLDKDVLSKHCRLVINHDYGTMGGVSFILAENCKDSADFWNDLKKLSKEW